MNSEQLATQLAVAFDNLVEKKGPGNDFLGWVDLPVDYDQEEFERIKIAANKIREQSDVLLVYRDWWLVSGSPCSY